MLPVPVTRSQECSRWTVVRRNSHHLATEATSGAKASAAMSRARPPPINRAPRKPEAAESRSKAKLVPVIRPDATRYVDGGSLHDPVAVDGVGPVLEAADHRLDERSDARPCNRVRSRTGHYPPTDQSGEPLFLQSRLPPQMRDDTRDAPPHGARRRCSKG